MLLWYALLLGAREVLDLLCWLVVDVRVQEGMRWLDNGDVSRISQHLGSYCLAFPLVLDLICSSFAVPAPVPIHASDSVLVLGASGLFAQTALTSVHASTMPTMLNRSDPRTPAAPHDDALGAGASAEAAAAAAPFEDMDSSQETADEATDSVRSRMQTEVGLRNVGAADGEARTTTDNALAASARFDALRAETARLTRCCAMLWLCPLVRVRGRGGGGGGRGGGGRASRCDLARPRGPCLSNFVHA